MIKRFVEWLAGTHRTMQAPALDWVRRPLTPQAQPEPLRMVPKPAPLEDVKPITNDEAVALMSDKERRNNFLACMAVADCFAGHLKAEIATTGLMAAGRVDMLILHALADFTAEVAQAYGIPGYEKQEKRRIIIPN